MQITRILFAALATATLAACAATPDRSDAFYSSDQSYQAMEAGYSGTVIGIRKVTVASSSNATGTMLGAGGGYALGRAIGGTNGRHSVRNGLLGAVAGAIAGNVAQRQLGQEEGLRVAVRADGSNKVFQLNVPFKGNEGLRQGDHVCFTSSAITPCE